MRRLFVWSYRWLSRALPDPYRSRYRAEALALVAARLERAGGIAAIRLGCREVLDLLKTIRRERAIGVARASIGVHPVLAIRSLLTTPVLSVAAIATLTVAVGINLAMFGLIGRALVNPPPFVTAPDHLFGAGFQAPNDHSGQYMTTTSYVVFKAIRDGSAIAGAAAAARWPASVILDGEQRQVSAMGISELYFDLLGAKPIRGRGIMSSDEHSTSASAPAVVSYGFWQSAFGGDANIIGRRLIVAGIDYSVTGVMPEGFTGHTSTTVDVWVPFAVAMRDTPDWDRTPYRRFASVLVRLTAGESRLAAEAEATAASGDRVTLLPIAGSDVGTTDAAVAWWLSGVSVLVLIIGLANAGTLLAVRGARRRYASAVRAALGASRGRLIGEAAVESFLLAGSATLLSVLSGQGFDEAIRRVLFPSIGAATGAPAGLVLPALAAGALAWTVALGAAWWQLPRPGSRVALDASTRGTRARSKTMTTLLVVQTALSTLLLVGAGLFGQSFHRLASQDFGMRMRDVIVVQFAPGTDGPERGELFSQSLDAIRSLPGVETATVIAGLPFGSHNIPPISVPGRDAPPSVGGQLPFLNAATPEFMRILEIGIVDGRGFLPGDERSAPVVVVNETMARGVWPGERAVGKCVRIGFDPDFDPATAVGMPVPSAAVPCREVIGVARDVRQRSVLPGDNEDRLMQYYVPISQVPAPPFMPPGSPVQGLLLRARVSVDALAPLVRRVVIGQRTNLPFVEVRPYGDFLEHQERPWRLATTLLALFSALALAVAAIGLFAAFAHMVGERRHEMAIRLAIGAHPDALLRMILREVLVIATAGVVTGAAVSVIAARGLGALLFQTAPADPLVLGGAALVMWTVACLATWHPARTAARADPNTLTRRPEQ